jgi:hypothetical protein
MYISHEAAVIFSFFFLLLGLMIRIIAPFGVWGMTIRGSMWSSGVLDHRDKI